MLRLVIKKELLESILSFKFVIIFPATVALFFLSFLMGIHEYKAQVMAHSNVVRLNRDQLERSTDWRQVGEAGVFVSRRPSPLTVFATGVFGITGQVARVVDRDLPTMERGRLATNPTFMLFGSWDFHFVVRIVLSLFAFLFAYDAISGEKETGTLRVLLSYPISRSQIIFGKAVGRFLSLGVAFTLAFLIGFILISVGSEIHYTAENHLRIVFIFLGSLMYLGIFFAIGLMASCLADRSIISLLLSLFIWVLLIFAIPKAAVSVASFLRPVPTPAELEAKKAALAKDMHIKLRLSEEEPLRRWLSRPAGNVSDAELYRRQKEAEKEFGRLRQLNEAEHAEKLYRLHEEYLGKQRALHHMTAIFSRFSPAACYDYFITELAETGPSDIDSFLDQLLDYQKRFSRVVSDMRLGQEIIYVVYALEDPFKLTRPDLSKIPNFEYKSRPWQQRWARAIGDFGLLSVYATLIFLVSYVSFLTYDPR
jgi:ABC-type transport system involved in multi-copper enzyme maturation permease subunit